MSELKSTPGDWLVDGTTVYALTRDGKGRLVNRFSAQPQSCMQPHEADATELVANAHLIAASRKMYSILERLEKFCDDVTDEDTYLYSEAKKLSSEIDDLLTQARGEQQ